MEVLIFKKNLYNYYLYTNCVYDCMNLKPHDEIGALVIKLVIKHIVNNIGLN